MANLVLPYRKPQEGRDYWIKDGILADPMAVVDRALACTAWELGFPHRQERWPGMRMMPALTPEELEPVEAWVRSVTGARKLWVESSPEGATLNHNCIQVVGGQESGPRPHTDSRRLAKYAGVLYLQPKPRADAGTSFYRLKTPTGQLSGNLCPPQCTYIHEAIGVRALPLSAWHEELAVPNVFNRMILYRADLVHSATRYFGHELKDRRITAVFFWMA